MTTPSLAVLNVAETPVAGATPAFASVRLIRGLSPGSRIPSPSPPGRLSSMEKVFRKTEGPVSLARLEKKTSGSPLRPSAHVA